MDKLKLNIYDNEGKVVKTCEAKLVDLTMGTIIELMELLNVDNINDTSELLRTVYKAWTEVREILSKVFPDVEDEEWNNVKLSELLPMLVFVLKDSFSMLVGLFGDAAKNIMGA